MLGIGTCWSVHVKRATVVHPVFFLSFYYFFFPLLYIYAMVVPLWLPECVSVEFELPEEQRLYESIWVIPRTCAKIIDGFSPRMISTSSSTPVNMDEPRAH
jgi:hypothetical protein